MLSNRKSSGEGSSNRTCHKAGDESYGKRGWVGNGLFQFRNKALLLTNEDAVWGAYARSRTSPGLASSAAQKVTYTRRRLDLASTESAWEQSSH